MDSTRKPVAVVVGATSKWQADGRNTQLAHGKVLDDSDLPVGVRWGVGGAIAQKFAQEGFVVVLTTRRAANAAALEKAIKEQGGDSMIVELDLVSHTPSPRRSPRFARPWVTRMSWCTMRATWRGVTCRPRKNCWSTSPSTCSTPRSTLPAVDRSWSPRRCCPPCASAEQATFLISNNAASLRGRKRLTGQSLYYPRVMMRTLAQVLTEEYSEYGVHVANIVIDGTIDSPGTRALPRAQQHPELVMNPVKIAEAFYYLHTQDKSCWTHELQLTPFATKPSF